MNCSNSFYSLHLYQCTESNLTYFCRTLLAIAIPHNIRRTNTYGGMRNGSTDYVKNYLETFGFNRHLRSLIQKCVVSSV